MTYYSRHREIMLAKQNARNITPEGRKNSRIASWIKQGHEKIIGETWDIIYEKYFNKKNCEQCNVLFIDDDIPYGQHKKNFTPENKIVCYYCSHHRKF